MPDTLYIKLRYRGRLEPSPDNIISLIQETEDICRTNGWKYHIWDEDWARPASLYSNFDGSALHFKGQAPLKGISFSVGESETVWLTFQPDGTLQSLMTLVDPGFTADADDMPWQRVKTGFDGAKTHLEICKLFRYLSGRYFEVFEVTDESGYWTHGDDARFTEWITEAGRSFQQFDEELAALLDDDSLSPAEHRKRMKQLLDGYGDKFRRVE